MQLQPPYLVAKTSNSFQTFGSILSERKKKQEQQKLLECFELIHWSRGHMPIGLQRHDGDKIIISSPHARRTPSISMDCAPHFHYPGTLES